MKVSFAAVLFLAIATSAFALQPAQISTQNVKDGNCELCTYVVGTVESWVASNYTEQEIVAMMESLCSLIPSFEPICDQLVETGVHRVIKWIIDNEKPAVICAQLGFCNKRSIGIEAKKPYQRVSTLHSTSCFMCEEVIDTIEGWLSNEHTQQEIEANLELICDWVPSFDKTCQSIIDAGVPSVIHWIQTYENGTAVCEQLKICGHDNKKALPTKQLPLPIAPEILRSDTTCGICKTIVGAMESWVAANHTVVTVEMYLEDKICAMVPSFQTVCNALIETGVPTIVYWIETNEDAETICFQVSMCAYKAVVNAPLSKVVIN